VSSSGKARGSRPSAASPRRPTTPSAGFRSPCSSRRRTFFLEDSTYYPPPTSTTRLGATKSTMNPRLSVCGSLLPKSATPAPRKPHAATPTSSPSSRPTSQDARANGGIKNGAHPKTGDETQKLARIRAEELGAQHHIVTAKTTETTVRAGATFVLTDALGDEQELLLPRCGTAPTATPNKSAAPTAPGRTRSPPCPASQAS